MDRVRQLAFSARSQKSFIPLLKSKGIQHYFVGMGPMEPSLNTSMESRNIQMDNQNQNQNLDRFLEQGRDFANTVGLDLNEWPLLLDPYTPLESLGDDIKSIDAETLNNPTYQNYDHFGLIEADGWLEMFRPTLDSKKHGGMVDLNTFTTALRSLRQGHVPVYHKNNAGGSLFRQGGSFILSSNSSTTNTDKTTNPNNSVDSIGHSDLKILFAHVDFTTGGGPSVDELINTVNEIEL